MLGFQVTNSAMTTDASTKPSKTNLKGLIIAKNRTYVFFLLSVSVLIIKVV